MNFAPQEHVEELQRQIHMEEIDLQEQIGKGGYGAVYKGTWRGVRLPAIR